MKVTLLILFTAAGCGALSLQAKDKEQEREEKAARKAEKAAAKAAAAPSSATSSQPETAPAKGFDAFQNVRQKNIFDPTRRGVRADASSAAAAEAAKRGRSLALTGTMVTEGKALAFFSGSAAEGNRVIASGQSVAGYKVTAIAPNEVSLERDGRKTTLAIGRQLTFDADGGSGAPAPIVERAPDPAAELTGVPVLPGASADKAELLRRMMERRVREVGR